MKAKIEPGRKETRLPSPGRHDSKSAEIMIPIHKLLNRIRWDKDFGRGCFEIGYFDHIERKVIRIPIRELHFEQGNSFSFLANTEW